MFSSRHEHKKHTVPCAGRVLVVVVCCTNAGCLAMMENVPTH